MKKYKTQIFVAMFIAILGGLLWLAVSREPPSPVETRKVIPNEKFFP